jgi:hypothetical protein
LACDDFCDCCYCYPGAMSKMDAQRKISST